MARLLPSLREKKRYITFAVRSAKPVTGSSVRKAIWDNILGFIGTQGAGEAGPWYLPEKWNANKQIGVLKVGNHFVDACKASLALIQNIDKQPVIIRSLQVSGMLNKR